MRPKLWPRHAPSRIYLDRDSKSRVTRAESVAYVSQVPNGRANPMCKGCAIIWCKSSEIGSKFHQQITPFGVLHVNTLRCYSGDALTGWLKIC